MAFGMKKWIGTVVVACALLALWQLPPDPLDRRIAPQSVEIEERYRELTRERRLLSGAIQRMRWSDSLSALTVETAVDGLAFAVHPSSNDLRVVERLERRVREEIAALPMRDRDLLFGYYHQRWDHAAVEGINPEGTNRTETYVGNRDGQEYCLQVRVSAFRHARNIQQAADGTSSLAPRASRLGGCRLFMQYGMPGPAVMEWLEAGGIAYGMETGEAAPITADNIRSMRLYRAFGVNTLTGIGSVEIDRCRAGIPEACGELFTNPESATGWSASSMRMAQQSPALAVRGDPFFGLIAQDEAYLLHDLEAQFGREAFARFWTSELPFEAAFEDAYGMDVNGWMSGWTATMQRVIEATPALPSDTVSLTLTIVLMLFGFAYLRNRRRTVA